jgi:hypothetical protein
MSYHGGRTKKHSETQRREIVRRYEIWRQNMPKRLCDEYSIDYKTLGRYVAEFLG